LPDLDLVSWLAERRLARTKTIFKNVLSEILPKRFAELFCDHYSFNGNLSELSEKRLKSIVDTLQGWQIFPESTVGFRKAEVTKGGVDTNELSSKTMQSKKIEGLYFIGEVVDVTGQLGGYNFQWAWSSGFVAGESV
jgi:predicted Rossmann fold flavoprotein